MILLMRILTIIALWALVVACAVDNTAATVVIIIMAMMATIMVATS